jgi:hypothetical protein
MLYNENMKKLLFGAALITMGLGLNVNPAFSGSAIFIQPYEPKQDTFESNVPRVVKQQRDDRSQRRSFNPEPQRTYEFVKIPNPFEGTSYGRIKNEIVIFDEQSGRSLNQYDYLALQAARGNRAELNRTAKKLQATGVFDPARYQSAVNNLANGGRSAVTGGVSNAIDMSGGAGGGAGGQMMGGMMSGQPAMQGQGGQAGAAASGPLFITRNKKDEAPSDMPQKVHGNYGDDPTFDPAQQPRTSKPIFLR